MRGGAWWWQYRSGTEVGVVFYIISVVLYSFFCFIAFVMRGRMSSFAEGEGAEFKRRSGAQVVLLWFNFFEW